MTFKLHLGDCLETMMLMPDNSVDSIVTDPPYGINFMGQKWDYDVPRSEIWAECLRVLNPGGHLLAFAGTRTQHRMAVNIEDAGFEIRDMIAWVYGSGFPKSKNVGDGWGTALKPALEPITLARKPLAEKTVAANVLTHGTGAMNIEASRVPLQGGSDAAAFENNHRVTERLPADREGQALGLHDGGWKQRVGDAVIPPGRWPANLIHDGSAAVEEAFPQAQGQRGNLKKQDHAVPKGNAFGQFGPKAEHLARGDAGSAARFFYAAKASNKDREAGNDHPTVKPTDLMRYLCRLVTPAGGTVLDPFMGSGSTGKAAVLEGFQFIGIERDPDYVAIASRRISDADFSDLL